MSPAGSVQNPRGSLPWGAADRSPKSCPGRGGCQSPSGARQPATAAGPGPGPTPAPAAGDEVGPPPLNGMGPMARPRTSRLGRAHGRHGHPPGRQPTPPGPPGRPHARPVSAALMPGNVREGPWLVPAVAHPDRLRRPRAQTGPAADQNAPARPGGQGHPGLASCPGPSLLPAASTGPASTAVLGLGGAEGGRGRPRKAGLVGRPGDPLSPGATPRRLGRPCGRPGAAGAPSGCRKGRPGRASGSGGVVRRPGVGPRPVRQDERRPQRGRSPARPALVLPGKSRDRPGCSALLRAVDPERGQGAAARAGRAPARGAAFPSRIPQYRGTGMGVADLTRTGVRRRPCRPAVGTPFPRGRVRGGRGRRSGPSAAAGPTRRTADKVKGDRCGSPSVR
jgi:hypothetical protein